MSMRESAMPNLPPFQPIQSQLANDPEMVELIDLFVGELPKRIASLTEAWRTQEFQSLQRLAHQLKGSCAGYGFPAIGKAAATVEDCIRTHSPESIKLEELAANVKELITLCNRATPPRNQSNAA
jgi:HPt (histidine-containing phosphotransfer) domain-containing protein